MDTSKEYIKMCEKAEEIQKNKRWLKAGDFCRNPYSGDSHAIGTTVEKTDLIWLPRQDQLQEMVKQNSLNIIDLNYFVASISLFLKQSNKDGELYYSLEQLWLAFVMKEKYNKTWNGKEWLTL